MARFHKQTFLNRTTNEIKIFSYNIPVKKKLVEEANLQDVEVEIRREENKIIIERKENETNNC